VPLEWTIGGVDKSDSVRYEGWTLAEMAQRGQVGAATTIIDDVLGTYLPPAQKAVTVNESSATPNRVFTGYVAERTTSDFQMPPGQRQWTVTFEDLNVLLDDRIVGPNGNRPAESDRERILWLLSDLSMGPITSGVIHAASDNVDMDAVDYRGKRPRDVLEDCSQKSGCNYFVYDHSASGTTLAPKLFYDLGSNGTLPSTLYLSDSAADVDSTTVFGVQGVEYSYDPSRVYSRVRVRYKQGSTTQVNDITGSNFRVREVYKRYMRTKTEPKAIQQATKWLSHAATEQRSLHVSVVLPAASVNLIRAGMSIGIKLTRHGMTGYESWRITGRYVRPLNDVTYVVDLDLKDKIKPTRWQEGPDVSVDEEFSNATNVSTPDAAGVTIDADSITVRNGSGTVVIDGSSAFWSILASGSITLPEARNNKGVQKKSLEVTIPNVTTDPVTWFAASGPMRDGTGNWGQFLPMLEMSASGVILRAIQGRSRYASGTGSNIRIAIQVTRFSTTTVEPTQTVKYWVMDKRSI
jgi:hypothetical protein